MRDVATLDAGAKGPALHGLRQDHRRCAAVRRRRVVRRVHLAVVVSAAAELAQVLVRQMRDELPEACVAAEEMLADVLTVGDDQSLGLAVGRLVHAIHERAVHVLREQLVPLTTPDHLDDVPSGAAEDGFELLDDLAVPAHRPVEPLQVAVHDEDQVVQTLASGE